MKLNEIIDLEAHQTQAGSYDAVEQHTLWKICKFIKSHCSDYLSAVKASSSKNFLARGVHGSEFNSEDYYIAQPKNNRLSLGLDLSQHRTLIQCFNAVGFSATRNKTISCISDIDRAGIFGTPYYIFPMDGFSYTWSTKYPDIGRLNAAPINKNHLGYDEFSALHILYRLAEPTHINHIKFSINVAKKVVKELGFTDRSLENAIDAQHEVAVAGTYIAVKADHHRLYSDYHGATLEDLRTCLDIK